MTRLILIAAILSCASCDRCEPARITQATIDCTVANRAQIQALLVEFTPLLAGQTPNWDAVLNRAILAGTTIGGCALAELAKRPETRSFASADDESAAQMARATFARYRAQHAPGTVYRTANGDL